jgi:HAMP domain-containing protein/anti-sigma regulatory factor (Ser/Thr protein kinase)
LPLRSKLILVVSVPLFVILGFAGFGIANRLDDLQGQRQYSHLRIPNDALGAVQQSVENEGVLTTWYVAAKGDPAVATELGEARATTDRAVAAVDAAGRTLSSDDVSTGARRAWNSLESRLDTLDTLRQQADEQAGLPAAFAERYSGITADAVDVSARLARDVDDRQLSDSMLGIVSLRREQASAADDAMIVLPYLVTSNTTQFSSWITAIREQDDASAAFLASATPEQRAAYERVQRNLPDDPFRDAAGSAPTVFPKVSITPDQYYASWQSRQAVYATTITAVQRVVDNLAADLESEALRGVLAYGLGISLLVLLVLVLAWVMIRSVNRSLRSLTVAARDVAENQLPHLVDTLQRGGDATHIDPIPPLTVASKDEIGALAQAFNTIQETTVRVAEEQAAMLRKGIGDLYVNLARRNQSLVDRQIALLDVLEARAEDPDQLASLFELDHLATRMRRNAESLLVLSGAGQARQWTEAIPIIDVVRAASGEIADFARVSFVGFDGDIAVGGNAVADVTHILAELLENATTFSPPGTPVVVAGMLAERRFVVSITDEGIGMDDQRLAVANALLQSPPPPGLSLSRTLGLHVVAHLASRYGVRVQLRRSATNGVTAIVALPATVLTRIPTEPSAHAPIPPMASAPAAPPMSSVAGPAPEVVLPTSPVAEFVAPPASAWPEPEVIPPAFDPVAPVAPVPPAATPVGPDPARAAFDPDQPGLSRRAPGGAPLGTDPGRQSLPQRDPGNHLSHRPDPTAPVPGEYDARPRPERVHDLLTRHLRGIRDGRSEDPGAGVPTDRIDAEDRP